MTARARADAPPLPRGALAALSLCMLLPSLGISIANVALPTFAAGFGASFQAVQWVVLAYLLATTSLVVGAGRLGDIAGRRRLLAAGVVIFMVASMLCAAAPALWLLVLARAVQGAGAALLMAHTTAMVGEVVPKARSGSAMGLLGTMSAIGTALGPSLGGLLIAWRGWPAIFWINLPLGLLALWLVRRHLPARPQPAKSGDAAAPFDHKGTLLLAATLAAYALAMTLGRGRFGALNVTLLLATAAGAWLFVQAERRAPSPLIRPAAWRQPGLRGGLAMSALVSTVVMATLVIGPFYLSRSLGLDTALVGAVLSIGPVVAALAGVPAGRAVDRFGAPRVAIGALLGMVVGTLALALVRESTGVAGYVVPLAIVTAHYALFQAANNTAVMADVPAERRGVTSGLLNLSRNLGLVTGASVMGAVFAHAAGTPALASASPEAVATGMRTAFAVAAALVAAALVVALRPSAPRRDDAPCEERA